MRQPPSSAWARSPRSSYQDLCWVWDPEFGWLAFSWSSRIAAQERWYSIHLIELLNHVSSKTGYRP